MASNTLGQRPHLTPNFLTKSRYRMIAGAQIIAHNLYQVNGWLRREKSLQVRISREGRENRCLCQHGFLGRS